MLFDPNIEPGCEYCRNGTALGQNEIACIKHGIMFSHGSCGAFRYEPTKRVPPVLPGFDISKFSDEDFAL